MTDASTIDLVGETIEMKKGVYQAITELVILGCCGTKNTKLNTWERSGY
jgi:hypothetical protein